ncbi:hypothetical protein TNCV_5081281 [Trichonephila clavipes]|nr:hypothetical protein TNCV_5081281 [Trichonephila clavipes]
MSFTRRPGSGHPLQNSCREDRHIVRNARAQPTASSAAIQEQVASSIGAPVFSNPTEESGCRTFGIAASITCAALDTHP